jgi:hypothetical protein
VRGEVERTSSDVSRLLHHTNASHKLCFPLHKKNIICRALSAQQCWFLGSLFYVQSGGSSFANAFRSVLCILLHKPDVALARSLSLFTSFFSPSSSRSASEVFFCEVDFQYRTKRMDGDGWRRKKEEKKEANEMKTEGCWVKR